MVARRNPGDRWETEDSMKELQAAVLDADQFQADDLTQDLPAIRGPFLSEMDPVTGMISASSGSAARFTGAGARIGARRMSRLGPAEEPHDVTEARPKIKSKIKSECPRESGSSYFMLEIPLVQDATFDLRRGTGRI